MKFKVGDKVKIINYGSLLWAHKTFPLSFKEIRREGDTIIYDILPSIVGEKGIVVDAHKTQGNPTYAVHGVPKKYAWYDENQLELT